MIANRLPTMVVLSTIVLGLMYNAKSTITCRNNTITDWNYFITVLVITITTRETFRDGLHKIISTAIPHQHCAGHLIHFYN